MRHPVHGRLAELARLGAGELVVDLGCGAGNTLAALSEYGTRARFLGVDLRQAGLTQAIRHTNSATATFMVRADLNRPVPLVDECADVVLCHNVTELLLDPSLMLAEIGRVLRPTGRAVLSHTDFAGLVVHGANPIFTRRIVAAYADVAQGWMDHIDASAARRLPGLAVGAGLVVDDVEGHVVTARGLGGGAKSRLPEIVAAVRSHISRGLVDLTREEVDQWWRQLEQADRVGELLIAETAFITLAH